MSLVNIITIVAVPVFLAAAAGRLAGPLRPARGCHRAHSR